MPVDEACAAAGLPTEVAKNLGKVVFGADFDLRKHQAQSLKTSLASNDATKRNVVVTSGTGSGKTESFLVPVIARLIKERINGVGSGGLHKWWDENWGSANTWQSSRSLIENAPQPALRALLLYPPITSAGLVRGGVPPLQTPTRRAGSASKKAFPRP